MTERPFNRGILVCAISLALGACATNETVSPDAPRANPAKSSGGMSPVLADAAARAADPNAPVGDRSKIYKGTGIVVKGQESGGALPGVTPVQPIGSAVVLNFEAADLRDV